MLDDKDYHEQETDVYSLDYEYEPSLGEAESDVQDAVARPPRSQSSAKMEFYDWIQCVVSAVIFGILVFVFIGRVMGVDGMSMLPTLHHNDKFIMSNLFYTPKYGDIVVIKTDTFGDTPIVKRVIATEGQTVDIDFNAGVVYVDGEPLDEPYQRRRSRARTLAPTVPEGRLRHNKPQRLDGQPQQRRGARGHAAHFGARYVYPSARRTMEQKGILGQNRPGALGL